MSDIPTWRERAEAHPDHQSGMVSEDMIRARMGEEIADLRAEIERTYALLKDPNVVSINMLRGVIAMPSVEQIRHIYQDRLLLPDLATVVKERDEARAEVERLRASLKPFAQLYLWPDDLGEDMATLLRSEDHWCEATNEDADSDVFIKRRYIRAARAALEAKP